MDAVGSNIRVDTYNWDIIKESSIYMDNNINSILATKPDEIIHVMPLNYNNLNIINKYIMN